MAIRCFRETWRNLRHVNWQWLVFSSIAESESAIDSIAWARWFFPNDTQPFSSLAPARTLIARDAASAWVVATRFAWKQIQPYARSYVKLKNRRIFHDRHGFTEGNVTEVNIIAREYLVTRSQAWFPCYSIFFCKLYENSWLPIWSFANSSNIQTNKFMIINVPFRPCCHFCAYPHPSLVRGATFSTIRTSFGVTSSWPNTIDEFNGTTCHVNGSDDFLHDKKRRRDIDR